MITLSNQKETKARKQHTCDFCGERIPIGSIYLNSTHVYDGAFYDWKTHKYCAELADRMKMYDDCEEGVTMELFMEYVHEEHYDILTRRFARNELEQYKDICDQLGHVNFREKLWFVIRHFAKVDKKI